LSLSEHRAILGAAPPALSASTHFRSVPVSDVQYGALKNRSFSAHGAREAAKEARHLTGLIRRPIFNEFRAAFPLLRNRRLDRDVCTVVSMRTWAEHWRM